MRKGVPAIRILVLAVLILLCLGSLVARLWWVQVARGAVYTAKVRGRSQVSVRLPAVRGEILDRNGIPLVENRASFEVDFYLPDIVRAYRSEHGSVPTRSHRMKIRGMLSDVDEADIPEIVNETIIPRLRELDLEANYNAEKLQVHYRNDTLIPYTYREDLDFDTMARLLEHNVGLPGLKAEVKPVRYYPYGALAAHLLGYVGVPNNVNREEAAKYNFYQPDVVGKAQVEQAMDEYLRGQAGAKILQKDVKGNILDEEVELVEPVQGANVYLTIDAKLQYIVEQALRVAGRAAAVVLDPNNGDILAMASVPSFDPNTFIPSIAAEDWSVLTGDETAPLLNRAINAYVPGSTYKVVTALAGLRAGVGDKHFNCPGGISYGNIFMKCWIYGKGSHGTLDLEGGLKNSCNSFFYQYGNAAGIDEIDAVGALLGLGQKTGVPLSGENAGILPGPEWLREQNPNDRWRPGLTANVSIGQGSVLASPLQMAVVAATVANGGTVYFPRLIDRVVAQDGKVLLQEPAQVRANLTTDGGMTPEQIEHVRKGMWKVVNEEGGTARRARIVGIEVAGKTGTAQNWRIDKNGVKQKDNNTLFIAFAPYEHPKYAVCVLVQGGKSGGGVAGPLAAKILEDAFAMEKGDLDVQLARLDPAPGSFQFIESIDFDREIPGAVSAVEETVDNVAPPAGEVTDEASAPAAPTIRAAPDDEGRVTPKKREDRGGLLNFFNFGGRKDRSNSDDSDSTPTKRNPFRR